MIKKIKLSILLVIIFFSLNDICRAKEEIVVWAMGYEGTVIGRMAEKFEEEYPDIKVNTQAIPWDAAHERMLTAVVGRVPPDVSQMGTTWIAEFQSMNAFEPLDDYIKESELKPKHFFESTYNIGEIDGKNYGIPWYIDTRVLFYRTDILEEAGYENPPGTWDELLEMATELARQRDGYGISLPVADWTTYMMFLWQNNGSILSEDHQEILIMEDAAAEAVEYYRKFYEQGAAPLEDPGYDLMWAFKEGYYPMIISGPWQVDEIRQQIPEIEGKWSVSTLPKHKTGTSFVGGAHLTMFKQSENKEAAWKFIEFMSKPENQIEWFEIAGSLPSNIQAWETGYFDDKPKINVFGEQMYDTKAPPNIPEWEEIAGVLNRRLEETIRGGETIERLQRTVHSDIERIFQRREEGEGELVLFLMIVLSALFVFFIFFYAKKLKVSKGSVSLAKEKKKKEERAVPGGMLGKGLKKIYIPLVFIAPSILVLAVFLFFPIFSSFIISLTNWSVYTFSDISNLSFIGFENYISLFTDEVFWHALRNTFVFSFVGIPLNIAISLFLAVMIDKKFIKQKAIFRAGYFMPVVTTLVAVAVVWVWLYNPRYGLVNYILGYIGIEPQNWLANPYLALPSLIVMSVWKNFGINMVIILAGLQTIPRTLYEAASVDGADGWQRFWNITLPSLKSTLFFVVVMTTIGSFQFFAEPYIMTDGGPLHRTISMVMYMYEQGFDHFRFGYGSAVGFILFLCILTFTLIQLKYKKKLEEA